jgi:hypothetical protein
MIRARDARTGVKRGAQWRALEPDAPGYGGDVIALNGEAMA